MPIYLPTTKKTFTVVTALIKLTQQQQQQLVLILLPPFLTTAITTTTTNTTVTITITTKHLALSIDIYMWVGGSHVYFGLYLSGFTRPNPSEGSLTAVMDGAIKTCGRGAEGEKVITPDPNSDKRREGGKEGGKGRRGVEGARSEKALKQGEKAVEEGEREEAKRKMKGRREIKKPEKDRRRIEAREGKREK